MSSHVQPEIEQNMPNASEYTFGIVVAEWNGHITKKLYEGAVKALKNYGALDENIITVYVPGSFELTFGTKYLITKKNVDAVIAIGAVIRGETPHFDYICQAVTHGLTELNLMYDIPVVFGVLTTNDEQQALDRSGGPVGNKGYEAAVAAIKMAALNKN